jgi:hypothetical protein
MKAIFKPEKFDKKRTIGDLSLFIEGRGCVPH